MNFLQPHLILLLLILFPSQSSLAMSCGEAMSDPVKANELNTRIEDNDFRIDRGLSEYEQQFKEFDFSSDVDNLKRYGGNLLDAGAGTAKMLMDIRASLLRKTNGSKNVKLLGVGIKKPNKETVNYRFYSEAAELAQTLKDASKNEFEYIEGNIESLDLSKIPKVKMITDLFGAVSYSQNLSQVLQKYVDMLSSGGSIYIGYSSARMKIQSPSQKISLDQWLKTIPGLEVSVSSNSFSIKILKKISDVKIPTTRGEIIEVFSPPTLLHHVE